jgi:hypothetical protein
MSEIGNLEQELKEGFPLITIQILQYLVKILETDVSYFGVVKLLCLNEYHALLLHGFE